MSNEMIKNYIGKNCTIVNLGSSFAVAIGKIISVTDNWIEVDTKKGSELINAEFVSSIKIMPEKK